MGRYAVPVSKGPQVVLPPHPQACDLYSVRDYAHTLAETPIAVDLFCGAGGLSLGAELAGFKIVLGVDKNPQAVQTHRSYFGGASVCGDLLEDAVLESICEALRGVEIDLLAGGPPCQTFSKAAFSKNRHLSLAGGRLPDSRSDLWRSYALLVERLRPRSLLLENVPAMGLGRNSQTFRSLVSRLERLDYSISTRIVPSWQHGVPQYRERLIIVGLREGLGFSWPDPELPSPVLRDAIDDLPHVVAGARNQVLPYHSVPLTPFYRMGSGGENSTVVFDHHARPVRKDDEAAYRLMPEGGTYKDIPAHLRRYRDDIFSDKYKRLSMDRAARTITAHIAKDGYSYIHPNQHRTLTIREAARIQTFPDYFRFCGSPTDAYRQIGEAVPPLLAKSLALSVKSALEQRAVGMNASSESIAYAISKWYVETAEGCRRLRLRFQDRLTKDVSEAVKRVSKRAGEQSCGIDPLASLVLDELFEPTADEIGGSVQPMSVLPDLTCKLTQVLGDRSAKIVMAQSGLVPDRPISAGLLRLSQRLFGIEILSKGGGNAEILCNRTLGSDKDGLVYVAAQELADSICLPRAPRCELCPVTQFCLKTSQRVGTLGPATSNGGQAQQQTSDTRKEAEATR